MTFLKKKETTIQNIAFMALMACINVIFVLLSLFVPFLIFIILFVLPLSSALVCLYCKKRYYPIYIVVTITICLLIDLGDTFFYILPSLISGFILGILIKHKFPSIYMIATICVIQLVAAYAFIPLVKLITGIDVIDAFLAMFGLSDFPFPNIMRAFFIFLISIMQSIFAYVGVSSEIKKFYPVEEKERPIIIYIIAISLAALSTLSSFFIEELAYILMFFSFIFAIYQLIHIIQTKEKKRIILSGIIVLLIIPFFAFFYTQVEAPKGLLLTLYLPVSISLFSLFHFFFVEKKEEK